MKSNREGVRFIPEGKPTSKTNPELSDLLAEVNLRISEYAAETDLRSEDWEFVCECSDADCHERTRLTIAEYEALRLAGEPVLAGGHQISRSSKARARSRGLIDDAAALKAQADQQLKHTRQWIERRQPPEG